MIKQKGDKDLIALQEKHMAELREGRLPESEPIYIEKIKQKQKPHWVLIISIIIVVVGAIIVSALNNGVAQIISAVIMAAGAIVAGKAIVNIRIENRVYKHEAPREVINVAHDENEDEGKDTSD